MRKMILVTACAAVVGALTMPVAASDLTIKGTVVCFPSSEEPDKEAATAAEALACAKKGLPVGVRTADSVFRISGDYVAKENAKMLDFMAKVVIATGEVGEKDGRKMMNIKSIRLAK